MWSQTSHYSWHTGDHFRYCSLSFWQVKLKRPNDKICIWHTQKRFGNYSRSSLLPALLLKPQGSYISLQLVLAYELDMFYMLCYQGIRWNPPTIWQWKSDYLADIKAGETNWSKEGEEDLLNWTGLHNSFLAITYLFSSYMPCLSPHWGSLLYTFIMKECCQVFITILNLSFSVDLYGLNWICEGLHSA